jgi:DNA repair exonuclease SbcCD ATPase subunit
LKGEEYEFTREDIKKSLTNIYGIADKRLNVIQEAAKNYDNWQNQKKTQTVEQEKVNLSQMQEEVQRIQKEIPWANEPQRPINPTPEQAKNYERQMSEWNTHVERFQKGLYSTDPKIKAQTAMAACGYFKLAEDIKSYQSENAALKAQIQKLQSVGRTNTQPVVNAPKPVAKKPSVDFMMDDKAALEQMINEIEGR